QDIPVEEFNSLLDDKLVPGSATLLKEGQQLTLEKMRTGFWIWDLAANEFQPSEELLRVLDCSLDELNSVDQFLGMVYYTDREQMETFFNKAMNGGSVEEIEYKLQVYNNKVIVMLGSVIMEKNQDDQVIKLLFSTMDISRYKQMESQLHWAKNVFDNAVEGVMITDADGIICAVNPAFTRITGYSEEDAIGQNPRILKSQRHDENFYINMWQTIYDTGHWQGEVWNRRKNGEIFLESLSITTIKDQYDVTSHYLALFHDITEAKQNEDNMIFQVYYDALTELPNRILFNDRLNHSLALSYANNMGLAVIFMDIDRFKIINDTVGHITGDVILQKVAKRLGASIWPEDTLARWGGDEFILILEDIKDERNAIKVAKRFAQTLAEPIVVDDQEFYVTASFGIAMSPGDSDDSESLIKFAEIAMYRAKDLGRNNCRLYAPNMNETAFERLSLESDMHKALSNGEFKVYYQPKISLKTGFIVGMEALIRWQHPKNGLVSPAHFIPMAEENGLIIPIGEWVLNVACKQAKLWQEAGHGSLKLSVNLSARQFQLQNLVEIIESALENSGLDSSFLELEITETDIMKNVESAIQTLKRINDMGVHISIDDFGTGYSSLSYLKRFPLDALKVDQSFIRGMEEDEDSKAIVKAIISMSQSLNLKIVAEGVENLDQLSYLHDEQCDEAQGYYFSPPVPASEFIGFINDKLVRFQMNRNEPLAVIPDSHE
ncbi:MAG: EAL domain-containing protein, partial [Spirochaetota bacterium]|nr:EAL domain-containing protein [Spirochaetota bacterium]